MARKRLRQLLLLATAALALWVAAPALSLQPYVPEAVDFEQSLPTLQRADAPGAKAADGARAQGGGGRPGEGPVSWRSGVIEAPHRFDLVGLAGELRPLELRVREAGASWSEWVEIANGDPLYAGGSDQLEVRARGWRPDGTLHYVNVSGTATTADRILNSVRGGINAAAISVGAVLAPAAQARPRKPHIVDRGAWGANRDTGGCEPRAKPSYGEVRAVAIHHTVTSNDYSRSEAKGIVLGICRYHRNANGWNDIGYQALVDRFGRVYEGRAGGLARAVVGAQAQGYNAQTAGVAAIGTHTGTPISARAKRGFARFLAWKLHEHGIPVRGRTTVVSAGGELNRFRKGERVHVKRLFPHGRVDYTECPGNRLRRQIDEIKRKVRAKLR